MGLALVNEITIPSGVENHEFCCCSLLMSFGRCIAHGHIILYCVTIVKVAAETCGRDINKEQHQNSWFSTPDRISNKCAYLL